MTISRLRMFIPAAAMIAVAVGARAERGFVVADEGDRKPVAGATVIGASGMIAGFTDEAGRAVAQEKDFPATVRCMGYESATVQRGVDTVFLAPATYSLQEVTVRAGERPVTRVVTYAREYCSGATSRDTLQMYSEYMLEYFIADGKVKGFKKTDETADILAARRYARIDTAEHPDSVFRPKEGDEITVLSFLTNIAFVPDGKHPAPQPLREGAKGMAREGKYGREATCSYQNDLYIETRDVLANYKDHRWSPWFFKLLGLTMDMEEFDWATVFRRNDRHEYDIYDFVSGRYNLRLKGRGKGFRYMLGVKEGIDINCLIEQWPVSVERLTVDEYKAMRKEHPRVAFKIPENVDPLPEPIRRLVDRFE